jgi:hypothetical protein
MSRILSAEDQFKEHYLLLREYLSPYLQTLGQSQRGKTSAKDKLSKLPQEEFVKVSTDVYDEIKRRMYDSKNGMPLTTLNFSTISAYKVRFIAKEKSSKTENGYSVFNEVSRA